MTRRQAALKTLLTFCVACLTVLPVWSQTNSVPAKTEVIQLKNGDRLTGTVVHEDATTLKLSTRWQAELLLPKAEIVKREPQIPVTAPVLSAIPVPVKPATLAAATASSPKASGGARTDVAAEKPKPKGVLKGNLQIGADLRDSSVQSYLYTVAAKVNYSRGNWHNAVDYRYSYGKTDNLLSADRMDGSFKTDLDIGMDKKWFFYGLVGAGYDTVRKIENQFELGPGIGRHLLTRTNMTLSAETGFSYQQQDFSNAASREEMRLRLATDYFWRLNSKFSLESKAEIQPSFDDPADYRIRYETTVSYALWNNISWNVALIDLYDSKPTAGVTKNDLQIRSGVGIKF